MTRPATIRQADLERVARVVAAKRNVRVTVLSDGSCVIEPLDERPVQPLSPLEQARAERARRAG